MTDHILKRAKEILASAPAQGAPFIMLEMIISGNPPQDPNYGAITDAHCSRCKKAVYSTELYDTILSLTNDINKAVLLCSDCHKAFQRKFGKDMLPQN